MKIGEMVRMKVYGGEASLLVVGANGTHVNVCTQKEFEAAQKERRQPILVGFPITDVIKEEASSKV